MAARLCVRRGCRRAPQGIAHRRRRCGSYPRTKPSLKAAGWRCASAHRKRSQPRGLRRGQGGSLVEALVEVPPGGGALLECTRLWVQTDPMYEAMRWLEIERLFGSSYLNADGVDGGCSSSDENGAGEAVASAPFVTDVDTIAEAAEVRAATEAALLLSPSQSSQEFAAPSQHFTAVALALDDILLGRGRRGLTRKAAAQLLHESDGEAVDRAIASLLLAGHAYVSDDMLYTL